MHDKDPHGDRAPDLPRDPPSSRPTKQGRDEPTADEEVEDWSLADVIERVSSGAWHVAAMAWKDVSSGASTTGPLWVAGTCLVAVAAVLAMSVQGTTAWPPYIAVILILLVATWLAPAANQPREQRWQLRARRSPRSAAPDDPAASDTTAEAGSETG